MRVEMSAVADNLLSDIDISKDAFLDLRNVSLDCRELLRDLSTTRYGVEAREQMARFNILAANMNVYAEGVQALGFKLKDTPEISKLLQHLLEALKTDLEKQLLSLDEQTDEGSSVIDHDLTDQQSETSSTSSYRLLPPDEKGPQVDPQSKLWNSIQTTITSLSNLAMLIYQSGNSHRKMRVERFMNSKGNQMVYKLIESYARQKVDHNFPQAKEALRERLAKSIANRRARFSYLNQHHQKLSRSRPSAPEKQMKSNETKTSISKPDHRLANDQTFSVPNTSIPNPLPSLILSNTVRTKIDTTGAQDIRISRPESVSSVKVAFDKFPTEAKLDSTGTSFTCQYCYRKCSATESKGVPYQQHLIQDFEPFICIFEDCSNPFSCAGSYNGWITHMREQHSKVQWRCWQCENLKISSKYFSTCAQLEEHMKDRHAETITDSLRSTALEHSMLHDPQILQECPLCGGLPVELERQYSNQKDWNACDALQKHVRNHLISVASILLPIDMGQPDDDPDDQEVKDDKSGAQSGDHSQLGSREPFSMPVLYCEEDSCDCKKQNSISDWSTLEAICQSITDIPKELLPKVHDDPTYSPDKNTKFEWEFWWPTSLPPDYRLTGLHNYPGHTKDERLLELFGIHPSSITMLRKIVVAVDFGTTYSGLAWALTDNPRQRYVVDTWPDSSEKIRGDVPTTLLYDPEDASQYRWGHQIKAMEPKYECFKLGLHKTTERESTDLMKAYPNISRVPSGNVTVIKLVTDYLTALRKHMDTVLGNHLSREVATITPKEYILTIPRVWPDKVCDEFLTCASAAGMGLKKDIHTITETEAVALYVLEELNEDGFTFRIGDTFVICDAGEGDVNLVSYTVESLKPTASLREAAPSGHGYGSIFLNRIFAKYLKQRFATDPLWNNRMLLQAIEEFEQNIKRRFNGDTDVHYSIYVNGLLDNPQMGIFDGILELNGSDIQNIFDPVVGEIVRLVQYQIDQTKEKVKAVVLTGGFGENVYLHRRLQGALPPDISIRQSPRCSRNATLEGALIGRMAAILPNYAPKRIQSRLSRRHIGFSVWVRYQEGVHDPETKRTDHFSGNDVVMTMVWLVKKGEIITESEPRRVNMSRELKSRERPDKITMTLYSCDDDNAPMHKENNVKEFAKLTVDFSMIPEHELNQQVGAHNVIYYEIDYEVELTFYSSMIRYALIFGDTRYNSITVDYQ